MPDTSDPIMDSPAAKRRKIGTGDAVPKRWDSDNDSGDDLCEADYAAATIPTQPVSHKPSQLQYSATQMHANLGRVPSSHVTQPTQMLNVTQPTQPTQKIPEVLVGRSSPAPAEQSSPPQIKPRPRPGQFSRPNGVLANAMAPPGTAFRRPPGTHTVRPAIDLDSDEDPPVNHSSDEEQGLRSNIKPTSFTKGGRGLDSSPNRIQESPRAPSRESNTAPTGFMKLMSTLAYKPGGDDMASAYGSTSRPPRPSSGIASSATASSTAASSATSGQEPEYETLSDVRDTQLRNKLEQMQKILPDVRFKDLVAGLKLKKGSLTDALQYLADKQDQEADELAPSPVVRKGLAQPVASQQTQHLQPVRPLAKQQIKAPTRTIAERYGARKEIPQTVVELSDDEDLKPKRRLVQGRRPGSRQATPPSSPAPAVSRLKKKTVTVDSESEPEAEASEEDSETEGEPASGSSSHDEKLLKFLNECTVRDLAELCAQPEDTIVEVLNHRPFNDLDQVRTITITGTTKSGKKARARPVGDKIVDDCSEMLTGYDAVDDLVAECEKRALPVQRALRSWGVRESADGELQLMNLDEAHDSGIGTPSSTINAEDASKSEAVKLQKPKPDFIAQPSNMNPEYTLKNYQLVGLNWLNLLFKRKTSCILADDMGLGKTCQVISFLAYLQTQQVDGVHLVIVPGSTLENWLREFEKFAPDLNVRPYYGSQAERVQARYELEEEFHTLDAIVTTYDMAVGIDDNKFLRRLGPYSVCVYDEAHALRNPKSNRYQQLVRIGADFKVLLTGTPLQNNLQELIAILAFIMPDLFQDKREDLEYIFKHKASTKDTDSAALFSSERIGRARTMMTPFILRRKKHQVLDLPSKHCRVEYCDMTDSQANLYADVMDQAQEFYAQKSKASAKQSSNVIMSLRKAAIHPLLSHRIYDEKRIDRIVAALRSSDEFGGNPPEKIRAYITGNDAISLKGGDFGIHRFCADRPFLSKFVLKRQEWMDAGKVVKFKELVTQYAANGDRVLVFSQFTTAMDILEQVLETLGIKFVRLDGSTKMDLRQELIDTFYNDPEITVFMLSTRAGGAGINLAAANKVIIFDSGFNPQDDVQAENRAHRVGQTREVEVVRLVTRGTIEEQIHALGESKLALDERVAGDATGEDKAREKAGEQMVEKMLVKKIQHKDAPDNGEDLMDAFKKGLEEKGVNVKSKQAIL